MGLERNIITQKMTILAVTAEIAAGSVYSVISSGTGYTKSGVDGNLRGSAGSFLKAKCNIYLNGILQIKAVDIEWASSSTFILNETTDDTDVVIFLD